MGPPKMIDFMSDKLMKYFMVPLLGVSFVIGFSVPRFMFGLNLLFGLLMQNEYLEDKSKNRGVRITAWLGMAVLVATFWTAIFAWVINIVHIIL